MEFGYRLEEGSRIVDILSITDIISDILDEIDPEEISVARTMSRNECSDSSRIRLVLWMEPSIIPELHIFPIEIISTIYSKKCDKRSSDTEKKKSSEDDPTYSMRTEHIAFFIYRHRLLRDRSRPCSEDSKVKGLCATLISGLHYRR